MRRRLAPEEVDLPVGDQAFESILTAAKAGADWAWAAIYRDLAGPVRGYLASRGCPEPEDVASEVFVKVARTIHRFEGGESSFRSWVFVIAHRRMIDERRRHGRRPELVGLDGATGIRPGGDVESEAMELITMDELSSALGLLTEAQRDVIHLRMIAGLSLEQTAQVMGKRTGAIKALQHRALATLQHALDFEDISN